MSTKKIQILNGASIIPKSDWNQTDDTKADYIKNKPTLGTISTKDTIEKTDLSSDVQTTLDKADTAVQSVEGLATETYVDNKVASLVNSAPETLDTLNELAAALGNDANFSTTVATQIGSKVDKVDGKSLSTNDFTDTYKTKLDGIEDGANKTVVDSALSPTSTNPVQNKILNAAISGKAELDLDNVFGATNTFMGDCTFGGAVSIISPVNDDNPATKKYVDDATANEHTHSNKTVLDGITAEKVSQWDSGQVNVIETIKVNGTAQTPSNKSVNITVPTKTSQLTNDSGFITSSDIPEGSAASTTTPKMDGTASVGTEMAFARGDHVHPSDATKVDKVSGKGLSTNDLTNTLKSNYDTAYNHSQQSHAPSNSERNIIIGIQKNGSDLSVDSSTRKVNILVPTKTSELTNDSDYVSNSELDSKVDKIDGKGLSTNDYTNDEKAKLSGIEIGANKTVVDSELSSTSTNPVQNKIVTTALDNKANLALDNTFSGKNVFESVDIMGDCNFAGNVTINNPINENSPTTKRYVDLSVSNAKEAIYMNEGTFEGVITFNGDQVVFTGNVEVPTPDFDNNPATKKYVDDLVSTKTENIKTGTGTNSLYMNNTSSLTEPDDGGDLHTAETTSEAPQANGTGSFAIGVGTKAEGDVSVAEGIKTTAGYLRDDGTRNVGSHAEGVGTFAKSSASHAEGYYTKSLASNSHTEGFFNTVESTAWSGHAEGRENTVTGVAAHAEGHGNTVSGANAHAEGDGNIAEGENSHAEGNDTTAHGEDSHAEGYGTAANGSYSHAEGYTSIALATYSHAEGYNTEASGRASHAEGISSSSGAKTTASGRGSHAEGVGTSASGEGSHAEGGVTDASGNQSHAEGYKTVASALYAHTEGARSTASAAAAHSEGADTTASGECAHAEGKLNTASGKYSHVGGYGNTSANFAGTVIGQYAKVSTASATKYNSTSEAFVIGNGTADDARSNAFEVLFDGTVKANDKQLATQEYVDNSVSTKAPAYQYSTTDLTAGTSTLATGTLYFVYE